MYLSFHRCELTRLKSATISAYATTLITISIAIHRQDNQRWRFEEIYLSDAGSPLPLLLTCSVFSQFIKVGYLSRALQGSLVLLLIFFTFPACSTKSIFYSTYFFRALFQKWYVQPLIFVLGLSYAPTDRVLVLDKQHVGAYSVIFCLPVQ
jgi:hypothetical protein